MQRVTPTGRGQLRSRLVLPVTRPRWRTAA